MTKKCLIIYTSLSGNTEMVASRFKSTFEKNRWQCDMFKIDKKAYILNPPFDFNNYDFVCVGSGIRMHLPYDDILWLMRRQFFGLIPIVLKHASEGEASKLEGIKPIVQSTASIPHRKIEFTNSKNAVAFATYAGFDFGPKEAEPSLQLLALEIEHLGFKCIGQFCCPGKYSDKVRLGTYHGDIRDRPNEKDLLKAEMFIEEKLEQIENRI